jgi:GMP synthase (glutamine-hydrolysing)
VVRSSEREIGWFPVQRTKAGAVDPVFSALPGDFTPLHWHGENCQLPAGARQLAASEACPQQAFGHGDRVLGLQFHLESTPESVDALIQNCPGDLAPGRFVQRAEAIVSAHQRFEASNRLMTTLLNRFCS